MLSLPAGLPANWALVDVETSGLSASRDRVLSLAVVTAGADGTPLSEYTTLLDPGVDPGPVHIHGLTRDRLRGAPTFDRVAARVADLLAGRVMVAHNAQFDYSFLAGEFARAGVPMPVERRLCTLALNRRLAPPTPDLRLGTLAAHYGVPHARAHDALEDTRALAGILRASLAEARARRALPEPESGSLATRALVWRLTEVIMLSPAATPRATSSSRGARVSPVMAIFMPWTRGPPAPSPA
ncbi:exonuclease domain-containing protein [Actinomadura kijaniata]|uniref:exonuclease domain-containing protein n=1 Tax=Actinomadura kijaniata TaxID=46161 RepID=UPI003F1B09CB